MSNTTVDTLIGQFDNLCHKGDISSISCILRDLTVSMKVASCRSTLTSNHWNSIVNLSQIIQKILSKESFVDEEFNILAEYFRFLRNSCGGGVIQNHNYILSSNEILNSVKQTLNCFKDKTSEKELTILKCCIQLLGNLVCMSSDAKLLVWNHFLEHKIFQCLFKHENNIVREYTMMILHNSMSDEVARILISTNDGHEILTLLLQSLCDDLVDWGILFLEFILKNEGFFQHCYKMMSHRSRLLVLDIITEQLSNGPGNEYFILPNASLNYIKDIFIEYVMDIVQICNVGTCDTKSVEIARLLGLLCEASVTDAYCDVLKSSRELLEILLDTLKSVHLLGKTNSNAFSCISTLKIVNKNTKDEIECSPSYCFKKNLIRLIGNLSFNCKDIQDAVRQLDGIPLLLDCCNIDARNPFIIQWGILAIRNIMEKNSENQSVLASISVTGDLANSALIKEMGFQVCNEDGKCVLRSLQR